MADAPENHPNAPSPPDSFLPNLATKRQRRPSVRLGDIGEQPAAAPDSHPRRASKQWKLPPPPPPPHPHPHPHPHLLRDLPPTKGSSRTRPLLTLGNGNGEYSDAVDFRRSSAKDFRGRRGGGGVTKRVRTNWGSRVDGGAEEVEEEEELRDLDSPVRSPVTLHGHRQLGGSREGVAGEIGVSDEDEVRDWKDEGNGVAGEGGVRIWLDGLGLGRYAPLFEIHEVDDEVLPFLTMEDLKDMGINAVGSRRKLFCAIQKIAKSLPHDS